MGHLRALLAAGVADPAGRLSRAAAALARPSASSCWRVERDRAAAPPWSAACHELFAAQAARTPDAAAVVAGGEALTYGELTRGPTAWPAACAGWGSGRRRGSASASSARRSWSSALLGRAQGRRRLRAARSGLSGGAPGLMLADAGAAVLVTQAGLAARLPAAGRAPVLRRRRRRERIAAERGGDPGGRRSIRRPRLRHLHLGLDRPAQGGGVPHGRCRPLTRTRRARFAAGRAATGCSSSPR